jgi:hypothetical protein
VALPTVWRRQLKAFGDFEAFSGCSCVRGPRRRLSLFRVPGIAGARTRWSRGKMGSWRGFASARRRIAGNTPFCRRKGFPGNWTGQDWAATCAAFSEWSSRLPKSGCSTRCRLGPRCGRRSRRSFLCRRATVNFLHAVTMLVARLGRPYLRASPGTRRTLEARRSRSLSLKGPGRNLGQNQYFSTITLSQRLFSGSPEQRSHPFGRG